MQRSKDPDVKARIRLAVTVAVAVAAVLLLALVEALAPLERMLPAQSFPARQEGEARVHFLDVGQGDCTIVEFSDGACLVVDAGDGGFLSDTAVTRYLKGLKPKELYVVATHADVDHCGGVADLLRNFRVEKLYLPVIGSQNSFYREMLDLAAARNVPTQTLTRYDSISRETGEYAVCLSPHKADETEENESSAVLFVRAGGVNFLLLADTSAARERQLAAEYGIDRTIFDSGALPVRLDETQVVKVAHHGSGTSSTAELFSLLGAEAGVISCGQGNPYGHPAGETLARLTEYVQDVYRLDELGGITVTARAGEFTVCKTEELS